MDGIFGIGPLELILIAVIALIVLGPERLPTLMREAARYLREIRKLGNELTAQFGDELKVLDEINPRKIINDALDPNYVEQPKPAAPARPVQPAQPATPVQRAPTPATAAAPAGLAPAPAAAQPAHPSVNGAQGSAASDEEAGSGAAPHLAPTLNPNLAAEPVYSILPPAPPAAAAQARLEAEISQAEISQAEVSRAEALVTQSLAAAPPPAASAAPETQA